jgi:hypothetical protein
MRTVDKSDFILPPCINGRKGGLIFFENAVAQKYTAWLLNMPTKPGCYPENKTITPAGMGVGVPSTSAASIAIHEAENGSQQGLKLPSVT